MATITSTGTIPPAQKAQILYAGARADLANRLWRAAIGDGAATAEPAGGAAPAQDGFSLDHLMALLEGQKTPRAVPLSRASTLTPEELGSTGRVVHVSGLGPNQRFQPDLASAAQRTGIPAPALAAIVNAEAGKDRDGRWQVYSRNGRSSAAGLGQFLSGTWQGMAEMKGSWLNGVARAKGWLDESGKLLAGARSALLALRYDAGASINTIADYARHNLDGLKHRGVAIGSSMEAIAKTAYLGHYLGLADATRFLRNELAPDRARFLLGAQIGHDQAAQLIAKTGDAATAHRDWFLSHAGRNLRPDRFAG